MYDVIVIGGGPIGMACGIEATKKGLSYLIIEKGCLVNSLYNYPLNMTFFSTSDRLEIGDVPFISHNPKPTRFEALEYYRRVASNWNLSLHLYEQVNHILPLNGGYTINTSKQNYKTQNVVIATGFYDYPYLLNVPGEDLSKVHHYYKEPHPFYTMDIAVIGSANSAVDVALETFRKGAKSVTMIIRESEIGENVKYWVRPDIVNRIETEEIIAHFNSTVLEIKLNSLIFQTPDGIKEIPNDFVLAMTGYKPNYHFLESLSIKINDDQYRTPQYNPKTMESNIEGVFLAGVVCGGLKTNKWFIENSRVHAQLITDAIKSKNKIIVT
ncbi:MAG: YpdA family putative bacillithiol disulfide reductase [Flavobacteriaceae bacterium]|nr:YpdA family putative bacillithiol disulfide reductase [Flavobacteriaceae bacterium]MCY4267649.1 YpdA family putative bacillithiol disulfide reductase [Flavobacteriaceae bacterium]MCY4297948.1 YpdA family putative bacillithiol disulfide reductase [Flavobacteriaceae bacterium]